jgi:hypothetical protein
VRKPSTLAKLFFHKSNTFILRPRNALYKSNLQLSKFATAPDSISIAAHIDHKVPPFNQQITCETTSLASFNAATTAHRSRREEGIGAIADVAPELASAPGLVEGLGAERPSEVLA